MIKTWVVVVNLLMFLAAPSPASTKSLAQDLPVVIVDKAKFQLHLANYKNGLEIFKTYSLTLGKNSGDKMLEGDQKTPEGIYRFTAKYLPPTIKKKFGAMAFYVDYPNSLDRREKKTGFDIMLHSTDDPKRLEQPQDSDGCLVVDDAKITEISAYIAPPYTTLLIYDVMKPEYLKPESSEELKAAFNGWLQAWSSKNIDAYIGSYASDFRYEQMSRDQYRAYKESLNKKYETIQVSAREPRYFRHPKYDMVAFTQEYSSTFKGGRKAFVARGQKRIYFVRENGQLKIFAEEFSRR